jgi:hypothetical protein
VKGLNSAIYSIDLSNDGSQLALGGAGKGLMLFDWDEDSYLNTEVFLEVK